MSLLLGESFSIPFWLSVKIPKMRKGRIRLPEAEYAYVKGYIHIYLKN